MNRLPATLSRNFVQATFAAVIVIEPRVSAPATPAGGDPLGFDEVHAILGSAATDRRPAHTAEVAR
jgi:hypothetical protein